MRLAPLSSLLACLLLAAAPAWATDADVARSELVAGYQLKQAGRCPEALPHFLAALRLETSAKPLLNLSDCERRMGLLVAARGHARDGRNLARQQGPAELVGVADEQLSALDKAIAHLTVVVADTAPPSTTLRLDGKLVVPGATSDVDPGAHVIIASASGHGERSVQVRVLEGETQRVAVDVGAQLGAGLSSSTEEAQSPRALGGDPGFGTQKMVALGLGSAGIVSVGIGSAFGLIALSRNSQSNANGHCDSTGCDATGKQLRNEALGNATASTWLIGLGLAAVAGGLALFVTAPMGTRAIPRVALLPLAGPRLGGLGVGGSW